MNFINAYITTASHEAARTALARIAKSVLTPVYASLSSDDRISGFGREPFKLSVEMIPAGYLAKRVQKPERFQIDNVVDVFSVSGCINENFADYIEYWKHNGYWLFDSPEIIRAVAQENSIQLEGTSLFYYEVYEMEFDGQNWCPYQVEPSFQTNVSQPVDKTLAGFDAVTFFAKNAPECSPLSCNGMAKQIRTNEHCLFASFDEAYRNVTDGAFGQAEPGPYRIFAVYSVAWP